MISKYLLFPYYFALKVRDALYSSGKKAAVSFDVPVISVGNLSIGGTGKTPAVEAVVRMLRNECRVAVISGGYGRKNDGFLLVDVSDSADRVGDEPLQIKRKFPDVMVVVDKIRERAVRQLLVLPESSRPQVIVLDDGFQYRRLSHTHDIVLVDYSRPVFRDNLFPIGRLRDLPGRIRKADTVIVTKCPENPDSGDRKAAGEANRIAPSQNLFFSRIKYLQPVPVFAEYADRRYVYSKEIYLFTGIADDTPMVLYLTEIYDRIYHRTFLDHHRFSRLDILSINRFTRNHPRTMILTTEKDAQRLRHLNSISDEVKERLFYLPIEMEFTSWQERADFAALLKSLVPSGPKKSPKARPQECIEFTGELF